MLKEVKGKVLPRRLREIHCNTCGRVHFTPRDCVHGCGGSRKERDIEVECCGWKMYGKGYDKELKVKQCQ